MKKSFKRFLSSVLATVMAVAGMSIGMTSTAMAASYDDNVVVTTASTSKTWDFTGNTTGVTLKTDDTVGGIVIGTVASTKLHASGYFTTKAGSTISVPVPANSTGSLTIVANATQSSRYATLEGNNIIMTKGAGASADFTAAETADGDLDLSFAGGECKINSMTVNLTSGSFGEVATYTLTGACTGLAAGTEFTLTNGTNTYTAKVNADGASYAVSTQAGAFDTAATYTAELANYSASYGTEAGVTLTASDETTFTASPAITFTENVLGEIPAGTYTNNDVVAGRPNFDNTGLVGTGGKYTGDLKIKLSQNATITINGKCGSSDTAKSVTVSVNGAQIDEAIAGGATAKDFVASNVPAGDTTITFTSSNTTFQLTSITITYGDTPTESTESTTEAPTESTESTTEATETTTEAPVPGDNVITGAESLVADADMLAAIGSATTTDYQSGKFTLMNGMSADKSNKEVEGLGSFANRMKTNGKTTLDKTTNVPTNRAIKFTTAGAGTLQVVALAGGGTTTRDYSVYASDGTVIATKSVNTADCIASDLIALPKADTYYIACPTAACNFYYVSVVVGSTTADATAGKVISQGEDSYAIATVTAADLASAVLNIAIGSYTDSTTDVYQAAVINGQLIKATDVDPNAVAMYVTKVAGSNGAAYDFTKTLE